MKIIQLPTPIAILLAAASTILIVLGIKSVIKDNPLPVVPLSKAMAWIKARWLDLRIALTPVEKPDSSCQA